MERHRAVAVLIVGQDTNSHSGAWIGRTSKVNKWPTEQSMLIAASMETHLLAIRQNVLDPLSAEAFAVTDYSPREISLLQRLLPHYLGRRLRALGLTGAPLSVAGAGSSAFCVPLPPQPELSGRVSAEGQWFKLKHAWQLMVQRERSADKEFKLVVRLRFDGVHLPAWNSAAVHRAAASRAIYAATDHTMLGGRAAMEVLVGLWDAIGSHFIEPHGRWQSATSKPLPLLHLQETWQSQPTAGLSRETFYFYNKIVELPLPHMAATLPGLTASLHRVADEPASLRRGALRLLDVAVEIHGAYLDPSAHPGVRTVAWPQIACPPKCASKLFWTQEDGVFATETTMLQWILANNLTVLDLGLATRTSW